MGNIEKRIETLEKYTPAKPEKKGLLPGFEGVFAIAGLLAIGYVMMRRKR